jgi:hypothetical protein
LTCILSNSCKTTMEHQNSWNLLDKMILC